MTHFDITLYFEVSGHKGSKPVWHIVGKIELNIFNINPLFYLLYRRYEKYFYTCMFVLLCPFLWHCAKKWNN